MFNASLGRWPVRASGQHQSRGKVLLDACRKFTKRVEGKKGAGASMDRAKVNALRPGIGVMFACSDRQEALESVLD